MHITSLRQSLPELNAAQIVHFNSLDRAIRDISNYQEKNPTEQIENLSLLQEALDKALGRLIILEEKCKSQAEQIFSYQTKQTQLNDVNIKLDQQLNNYKQTVVTCLESLCEQNASSARLWRQKALQTEEQYNQLQLNSNSLLQKLTEEKTHLLAKLDQKLEQEVLLEKAKQQVNTQIHEIKQRYAQNEQNLMQQIQDLSYQLGTKEQQIKDYEFQLKQQNEAIRRKLEEHVEEQLEAERIILKQKQEYEQQQHKLNKRALKTVKINESEQEENKENKENKEKQRRRDLNSDLSDTMFNQISEALMREDKQKSIQEYENKKPKFNQEDLDKSLKIAYKKLRELDKRRE
ncbi:Conserved_hypothetical protein [Hexamita inflata]|uniref:Uncharacterized protein n=1 Tax=Hexamita inflata TaxID=28002 RepID=A0AA86PQ67_9EUKA|nr:Conserved hypothetical protein [Hexamita inflata]